jgi:uncharacterized RDD family membrane protein YckC
MSESDNWQPPVPPTFSTEYETPFQQEPRAGFGIRLLAHICDGLNSLIVQIPFQLIGLLVSDTSITSDSDALTPFPQFGMGATDIWTLLGTIASFLVLAYWIGSRGGSPLRVRLGVLVLDQNDGSFIGTRRAVYRGLMGYVSQLALLLGYLWMLWDPQRQTWHDKVAQSVVVKR